MAEQATKTTDEKASLPQHVSSALAALLIDIAGKIRTPKVASQAGSAKREKPTADT